MQKIILPFLFAIAFSGLHVSGQNVRYEVNLKNGSHLKGYLLENTPDEVKIKTCGGNLFVFNREDVASILAVDPAEQISFGRMRKDSLRNHLFVFSYGILLGDYWNEKQIIQSTLIEYNFRPIKYLAAGMMTGFEELNELTVPVGFNVKGMYPLGRHDIFVGITAGKNYPAERITDMYTYKNQYGGVLLNVEAGTRLSLSGNSILIAAGFRYNELHYTLQDWWYSEAERTFYFKRFSLRMGFIFE